MTRTSASSDGEGGVARPVLLAALRSWRTAEAKKRGIPAFRILTDRTLAGIAECSPSSESELLSVSGIGPQMLAKYGSALLRIVAHTNGAGSG